MKRTEIKDLLERADFGSKVNVKGWVRTKRGSKNVSFIALNDGSTIKNVQLVVEMSPAMEPLLEKIHTGAALSVTGDLTESMGSGQKVEVHATDIEILGVANPNDYPLQPKKHSLEFLREKAHLRYRTNTFSAIARIRHAMIFAIHKFFNDRGFYNIHSPIITGSDAEGAGEMFQVTTLDLNNIPKNEEGKADFQTDFFGKATNLTVSGQLEAELAALALSKVYTFGPTFRAENSNTTRHLAEFWMIEPEIAFADLHDDIDLASGMLRACASDLLEKRMDDLKFFDLRIEKGIIDRLKMMAESPVKTITYTDAIKILENCNEKFEHQVKWGIDMQTEHERFLCEKHFKQPVAVINYPKDIKAFYMRMNDEGTDGAPGRTVAAVDVLVPGVGELLGGSQREERLPFLDARIEEMGLDKADYWWYRDLRKYGTVPHAGFGLGFERLVLFCTGMQNIRDVIPFPRAPKQADF
ncbi:MAG: asparagine--tRNA ligase [Bacteroidales bacterium]|nr:asparagine--tRNA ligase [Bacteroidales bacterium]